MSKFSNEKVIQQVIHYANSVDHLYPNEDSEKFGVSRYVFISIITRNNLDHKIVKGLSENRRLQRNKNVSKTLKSKYANGEIKIDWNSKDRCEKISNAHKANYNDSIKKSEILKKRKETNLLRYGVESYSKTSDFLEKSKNTKLIKYGDEKFNNRAKFIETCFQRYGVSNPLQNEDIKEKS